MDIEMEVNGKTRVCGLIGNPVEHTQSPVIHNTLAQDNGIPLIYVPFLVENGQLEPAVKGAFGLNILGMNVTVPYKNKVIAYLEDIDDLAKKIGAVNTLVRTDKGYKGYNTDITGLFRAMKSDEVSIENEDIIVLGAGGVGRAVTYMCAANGARSVVLLNRDAAKAKAVAAEVNRELGTDLVTAMALSDYKNVLTGEENRYIVIQCTSVGLAPNTDYAVIEDGDFYLYIKYGYDLIYTPWETKFMKLVEAGGGVAYNGLKMLLYQGIDAFELWNHCKISEESALKVYEILRRNVCKEEGCVL